MSRRIKGIPLEVFRWENDTPAGPPPIIAVDEGGFSTSIGSGFHASQRAPAAVARRILVPGLACENRREEQVEIGWKGRWMKAAAHCKNRNAGRCLWGQGGAFHPRTRAMLASAQSDLRFLVVRGGFWQSYEPGLLLRTRLISFVDPRL